VTDFRGRVYLKETTLSIADAHLGASGLIRCRTTLSLKIVLPAAARQRLVSWSEAAAGVPVTFDDRICRKIRIPIN